MPLCIVLAPMGLGPEAKKQMMVELTHAIEEGYANFVTEIYLRELKADDVMVAGVLASDNPAFSARFKASADVTG